MFVGRKEILQDLETLWRKRTSSIVACRGRRRIGKSTLIREFARRTADAYIEIEGLPPSAEKPMSNQDEIDHFVTVLNDQTGCGVKKVERWYDAFSLLEKQIDDSRKTVVLLDEISWDTGFTGRFSRDYVIPELSLAECTEFWGEAKNRINEREILDVLSVTGGVPRYLEEVDPGLSADENIRRMCFVKGGELYRDFDAIFDHVLGDSMALKKRLLEELASGPMSGAELSSRMGVGRNGRFSEILKDLELGGFISSDPGLNPETGSAMRTSKYRLRDNYTRFYLKYVMPRKTEIETGTYRHSSLEHLPEWNAVMGLQFENLVREPDCQQRNGCGIVHRHGQCNNRVCRSLQQLSQGARRKLCGMPD